MWMQRISMRQRLIEKYERLRRGPVCEQPCRACHSSCWKHPWKQKRDQFRWSAREAPLFILCPCKKQAENRCLEMNGNEEETKSQVGKVCQEGMVGKNVSRFLPYPTYLTYQTYLTSRPYLTYTPSRASLPHVPPLYCSLGNAISCVCPNCIRHRWRCHCG